MRENVRNPHAHRSATDDQDLRSGSQALTAHRLRGTRGPDPTWVWFPINTRQWPVVRGGGRKPSLESCPLPSPASQGEWTVCSRVQTRPSGGPLAAPLRAAAGLGAMQSHGPQGQRPEGRQCSQQEQQGSQDLPRPPDPLGWAALSSCGGGGGAAPRARKERGRLEARLPEQLLKDCAPWRVQTPLSRKEPGHRESILPGLAENVSCSAGCFSCR